jgi:hypothetical protein
LSIDAIIKHGPLVAINGAIHFAKGAFIIKNDTPDFEGSLVYMVDWRNRLIASADVPFLKFNDSDGNVYTAQSVQFETTLAASHHIIHTLTFRNLCILIASKQPTTLDLDNIMITSNKYQRHHLWLGTANIFIGSASLTNHVTQAIIGAFNQLTLNVLC